MSNKPKYVPEYVSLMSNEFINLDGVVTCEFSTSTSRLNQIRDLLIDYSRVIQAHGYDARWIAYHCDTCKGYHGKKPIHVAIENYRFMPYDCNHLFDLL